jgi:hypothetical protein
LAPTAVAVSTTATVGEVLLTVVLVVLAPFFLFIFRSSCLRWESMTGLSLHRIEDKISDLK